MSVISDINNLQEKVKYLLTEKSNLRDNDKALCARIWAMELGGIDEMKKISTYDFMHLYVRGNLSGHESIGRARRLLQNEFPELRGEKYEKRQREQEDVRNNIKRKKQ